MKEKVILFKKFLKEGYTQKRAAGLSGIGLKSTTYYIKKYSLEVPKKYGKYRSNETYFDVIDSERKAYLLGFFLADGYIDGNRIRVNNSIDDLEIVNIFKEEISPESPISYSNKQAGAKFRKSQVHFGITSKHMIATLKNKYGIIRDKTHNSEFTFNFSTIPKELLRHFIRGYFDGDGSVSFNLTKTGTIYFNFSFIFNSLDFCNQIAEHFKALFTIIPVTYTIIGKTCTYYALRFNCKRDRVNKMKGVYNYLYNESTIFLLRKKIKFEQYFEYRANSRDNTLEQCNA